MIAPPRTNGGIPGARWQDEDALHLTLRFIGEVETPAANDLSIYTGTYALQAPDRVVDLRVWLDEAGSLTGQLVGLSNPTTLRPDTGHRFLHATRDDIWFLFTVENGRATRVTFNMPGRGEMSGARKP